MTVSNDIPVSAVTCTDLFIRFTRPHVQTQRLMSGDVTGGKRMLVTHDHGYVHVTYLNEGNVALKQITFNKDEVIEIEQSGSLKIV